jgi:hypothetical protein
VIVPSVNQRHHSCVLWEIQKAEHFRDDDTGAGAEQRGDQQKRHGAREVTGGSQAKQARWTDLSCADGDTHYQRDAPRGVDAGIGSHIYQGRRASATGWRPVVMRKRARVVFGPALLSNVTSRCRESAEAAGTLRPTWAEPNLLLLDRRFPGSSSPL